MTSTHTKADSPRQLSTVRQLFRLYRYARPALPWLIASTLTAGVATVCGLAFPLVIQAIIDGPITEGNLAALWPLGIVLTLLGVGEAVLFFIRRILTARPVMRVEARMRDDLYDKLQRLPVAFHDRWPAGQLLSRAVSDLSTIRRFLAFGLIFLIVNIATFVIGVGILLVLSWQLGLVVAALAIPLVALSFVYESRYRLLARRSQDQVGDLATDGRGIGPRHPHPQGVRPQRPPRAEVPPARPGTCGAPSCARPRSSRCSGRSSSRCPRSRSASRCCSAFARSPPAR